MMTYNYHRTKLTVDLGQLRLNLKEVKSRLSDGCDIIAVVKANAYGHGAVPVAKALQNEGVSSFADNLNPESLATLTGCMLEADLQNAKPLERFQFMRQGYFCIDKDSTPDNIIINRTVALKDSFKAR